MVYKVLKRIIFYMEANKKLPIIKQREPNEKLHQDESLPEKPPKTEEHSA